MALAGDERALRLPFLLCKRRLLQPNPGAACEDCHPNSIVIKVQRDGDAHPAMRWVDTDMESLDVFADNFNGYPANRLIYKNLSPKT